jgi:hypothetical protein
VQEVLFAASWWRRSFFEVCALVGVFGAETLSACCTVRLRAGVSRSAWPGWCSCRLCLWLAALVCAFKGFLAACIGVLASVKVAALRLFLPAGLGGGFLGSVLLRSFVLLPLCAVPARLCLVAIRTQSGFIVTVATDLQKPKEHDLVNVRTGVGNMKGSRRAPSHQQLRQLQETGTSEGCAPRFGRDHPSPPLSSHLAIAPCLQPLHCQDSGEYSTSHPGTLHASPMAPGLALPDPAQARHHHLLLAPLNPALKRR